MKKIKLSILPALTLFIASSIFYSCSSKDSTIITDESSKIEFLSQLESFNLDYQSKVIDIQQEPSEPSLLSKKCNWKCKIKRGLVLAAADLAGAAAGAGAVVKIAGAIAASTAGTGAPVATGLVIAGAVVGGAGASIAAAEVSASIEAPDEDEDEEADGLAEKSKHNKSFGKKLYIENLEINYTAKYSYLKEVGKLHNKEVYNHYNGFLQKNSKTSEFDIIENSEEWKEFTRKTRDIARAYVVNDFDQDKLTKSLFDEGLISKDIENVLNVFYDIYNNSQNGQNIKDIVNFYINAISETNVLSNEDKEALVVAFSVASESPFYWINQN